MGRCFLFVFRGNEAKTSRKEFLKEIVYIYRVNKTLYILILLIINVDAWRLRIINISDNNWLIIHVLYLMVGFVFYGKKELFKWNSSQLKYWWWWVIGIVISMVSADFFYNQSILQSLITYRTQILLLQIPVLFKIAPTKEEVIKATMYFSVLMWVIYFLQLNNPYIIAFNEDDIEKALMRGEMIKLPGFLFPAIVIFYYLDKIRETFDLKTFAILFVCFLFLFFMQNRSILFSVTVLIGWTMLTLKKKNKLFVVLTMLVIVVVMAYETFDIWNALFEETTIQMGNEEYNRNKAYRYFLFDASPNVWCVIFGNGFLSSHVTAYMQDMMSLGIYNSDVGFIGYWNHYGIIPIVVFMLMLVPAAIGRHNSHFIRCWAIQILICGLTISYWGASVFILYFALFYYLYYYDLEENASKTLQ